MRDDLIKRSDAIAEIYKVRTPEVVSHHYAELFASAVYRTPSAERPQGEWLRIEIIDDDFESGVNADASQCSVCGDIQSSHYWTTTYFNYCPNCGARMKGADDE